MPSSVGSPRTSFPHELRERLHKVLQGCAWSAHFSTLPGAARYSCLVLGLEPSGGKILSPEMDMIQSAALLKPLQELQSHVATAGDSAWFWGM